MKRGLLLALALLLGTVPALANDKLTVVLDWFINPDHAAVVIAKEGGYFAKAGLDVTLVEPADPAAPPRLVAAGQGDIAVTYQPTFYLERADGLDLQRVGTAIGTPLNTLVVLESGPIKAIADLKGKTIGYSIAGYEQALLASLLATAGLTLDDVKLVDVNFALTQALIGGQVDAVIGAYRNFELTEMKLAGHPGRAFYPEELGFPPYDELIYVTTPEQAKADSTRRFLDATEQATLFVLNHPAEAWAMFIKASPKLDDDLNRQAWTDTIPRLAADPAAVDPRRYLVFAAFMRDRGLIKAVEPIENYIGPR